MNGTLNGSVKENSSLYNYLNTTWKDTLLYKAALTKEILLLKKEQYYTLGGSNIRWLNNGISFWLMDPGTNYGYESTITSTYVAGSGEVWGDQPSHQIYSSRKQGVRPVVVVDKQKIEAWIAPEIMKCTEFDTTTQTLSGNDLSVCPTEITIPSQIYGVSVLHIAEGTFSAKKLTKVTISNGIKTIGAGAFFENSIIELELPPSIETIGEAAFFGNQLTNLKLPNSISHLGLGAFNWNQLPDDQAFIYARNADGMEDKTTLISYGGARRENVVIPASITTIGVSAMSSVELKSITIPEGVTTIQESAFYDNKLTEIIIPKSVTIIQDDAFGGNLLTRVKIVGKASSSDFATYGLDLWGWDTGYSDTNITWNGIE